MMMVMGAPAGPAASEKKKVPTTQCLKDDIIGTVRVVRPGSVVLDVAMLSAIGSLRTRAEGSGRMGLASSCDDNSPAVGRDIPGQEQQS